MKKCKICKIEKDLSNFYSHPDMKDGYSQKCKECSKQLSKKRYNELSTSPEFIEKERKRSREKQHKYRTNSSKEESYQRNIDNKKKFPEKYKAHYYTARTPKKEGFHLHHWSYNKDHYRDTIELSKKSHMKAHRFMIYDQERFMYRNLEGELLDTKEKHLTYINLMIATKED